MAAVIKYPPKPENITASSYEDDDSCPYCHGTGWENYESSDGSEKVYGHPVMIAYSRKCHKCHGIAQYGYDTTNVPPQFSDADLNKFDFNAYSMPMDILKKITKTMMNDIEPWRRQSKGLYIWSKTPGSGKTFLACCLGKSLMMKHGLRLKFVTATDYMDYVADSYKRERGELDPTLKFKEAEILIIDDIGAQQSKEWYQQEMFKLINERHMKGRITLYTSNSSIESLNVGDRAISRIVKGTYVINMPEESIRKKLAMKEQDAFVKELLKNES